MAPNSCQPERTESLKTYPKVYPQKLRIISRAGGIREKLKYERFFDQFYWLKVTNSLNKMLTCFKVGILCIFTWVIFLNI
jgi:hypothetical protein